MISGFPCGCKGGLVMPRDRNISGWMRCKVNVRKWLLLSRWQIDMEGILVRAVDPLAERDFILGDTPVLGLFLVSGYWFAVSSPGEFAWPGVTNGTKSPMKVVEEGLA